MRIKINLKVFFIALLFILAGQSKFYAFFMAFLILHEVGHLVVGIILGFKPEQIQVMPLRIWNYIFKRIKKSCT